MRYFTWKGASSKTKGIYLEALDATPIGVIRSETQTVLGSSKVLHYTEGESDDEKAMDPVDVSLDCVLAHGSSINAAAAWLRGAGRLILPSDPDHYRRAFVSNQIDLARVLRIRGDRRFTVQFECEAWRYRYPEAEAYTISSADIIANPGSGAAEPLLRVYGSGDGTLMIGTATLMIADIDTYVDVDCEAQMVYKGSTSWGDKVVRAGDWPKVHTGGSTISWTGGITSVKVTEPRYRDY